LKLDIEILGTGCLSCNKMVEIAKEAVEEAGLSEVSRVTKVEDLQRMMELGVMSTPALVINDRLISAGKVYKKADLAKLLLAEAAK
jgi:small redox-active disulfide protein 2